MIVRRCAISLLFVASSQAFLPAGPSLPPRSCETAAFLARPSATELGYANDDNAPLISLTEDELREANSIEASDSQTQQRSAVPINDDPETVAVRTNLKKRLAICSIENFDYDNYNRGEEKAGVAEDIMKDLEPIRPWDRPASDPGLNARFSFVFTGVPTIGMKLITLLSRISVGFPVVDFRDVFLEVSEHNTKAKAIVTAKIFGQDMELNVLTDLEVDETCEKGTMMFETFDKITIQGEYDLCFAFVFILVPHGKMKQSVSFFVFANSLAGSTESSFIPLILRTFRLHCPHTGILVTNTHP